MNEHLAIYLALCVIVGIITVALRKEGSATSRDLNHLLWGVFGSVSVLLLCISYADI